MRVAIDSSVMLCYGCYAGGPWLISMAIVVWAGIDTDEELAHYIKKEPTTVMPWTSNERRINKMIEGEIIKFNYAPETTVRTL